METGAQVESRRGREPIHQRRLQLGDSPSYRFVGRMDPDSPGVEERDRVHAGRARVLRGMHEDFGKIDGGDHQPEFPLPAR